MKIKQSVNEVHNIYSCTHKSYFPYVTFTLNGRCERKVQLILRPPRKTTR